LESRSTSKHHLHAILGHLENAALVQESRRLKVESDDGRESAIIRAGDG